MFASVASKIFSYFLGSYIEELGSGQLELAILNGNTTLSNLKIKKTALLGHNIPVEVLKGCIHRIDLTIPWSSLFSKSSFFDVDEIFILGTIKSDSLLELDIETQNIHKEFDELCAQEQIAKESVLSGIVGKLLNKLEATISKIHIRIEYDNPNSGNTLALGIVIPIIKATTIDCPGFYGQQDVFRKLISIHDFSIYFDTNTTKINLDDFRHQMHIQMAENHQFILKDFSFNCIFEHSKGIDNTYINRFQIDTPGFDIRLNQTQWENIVILKSINLSFLRMRYYSSVGRPIDSPKSPNEIISWWRYARRCAFKKLQPLNFDPKKAMIFLRSRREMFPFMKTYIQSKNKEKFNSKVKLHQDFFGADVFLCLMTYSNFILKIENSKTKSDGIDITADELKTILKESARTTYYHIDFTIKELKVCLNKDDKNTLSSILFSNFKGLFTSSENESKSIEFKLGDIFVLNNLDNSKIFYLDHEQNKNSLEGNIDFMPNKRLLDLKIIGQNPYLYLNLKLLNKLQKFFKGSSIFFEKITNIKSDKKRDTTRLEIDHILETQIKKKINYKFGKTKIVIPTENEIVVFLDKIDILADDKNCHPVRDDSISFYESYQLNLEKFGIDVGEYQVCKPFSTEAIFQKLFIPMSSLPSSKILLKIDDVSVKLNRKSLMTLMNLQKIFQIDEIDVNKTKTEFKEMKSGSNFFISLLFEKINFSLEGKQLSTYSLEGMKSELTTGDNGMNLNLEFQTIKAVDLSNSLKFLAGSVEEKAFEGNLLLSDKTVLTAVFNKPDIAMTFSYVMNLVDFFTFSSEDDEKSKQSDSIFMMDVKIISPLYALGFPAKENKLLNLFFDMSEMSIIFNSNEKESLLIPFENLTMKTLHKEILKSEKCQMKMSEIEGRSHFFMDLPTCVFVMDQYNYRLVMDLAEYIPFFLDELKNDAFVPRDDSDEVLSLKMLKNLSTPNLVPKSDNTQKTDSILAPPETKKEDLVVHVISDLMNIEFYEGDCHFLDISVSNFNYQLIDDKNLIKMGEMNGKFPDNVIFANIKGLNVKFENRITDVNFVDEMFMNLRLKETNYLYIMFMDESLKEILYYDRAKIMELSKGLSPIKTNIEMKKITANMSKENFVYSEVKMDEMFINVELTKPDVHTIVTINGIKATTDKLGEITDFIDIDGKFYFEMVENKIIVNSKDLVIMNYQQQFFMDFVHYTTGIMNERVYNPLSPVKLKLFNYIIDFSKIELKMLPRPEIGRECGFVVCMDDCEVKSDVNDLNIINISLKNIIGLSPKGDKIFSTSDFSFPLKFITSFDVPPLSEGYDPKMIAEFKNPPVKYLHAIDFDIKIDNCEYFYQRNQTKQMCDVFCTFLDFEYIKPEPFKLVYNVDVNVNKITVEFDILHYVANVKNFYFKMRGNDQYISMGEAVLKRPNNKTIAKLEENSKNISMEMENNKKNLKIKLFSILFFYDQNKMVNLMRLLYRSPFLLTKWGMTPEKPTPMITEIDRIRAVLPVMKNGNLLLLFDGQLLNILEGDDIYFEAKNSKLKLIGNKLKYFSIVEDFNFSYSDKYKDKTNITEYKLGDTKINLSVTDITALYVIFNKMKLFIDVCVNEKVKNSKVEVTNHIQKFDFGNLVFEIYKNKLQKSFFIPLFRFMINPICFTFDPLSESKLTLLTSSFDSKNTNNQMWDMFVEPITLSFLSKPIPDQNYLQVDVNIKNLNVNFAHSILTQIQKVTDEIKTSIETKSITLVYSTKIRVQNDLGTKAKFGYNDKQKFFVLDKNESQEFQCQDDSDDNDYIYFWFGEKIISLKVSDFTFPLFISPFIVVYVVKSPGEVTIVFSSLLRVTNLTNNELSLLTNERNNKYNFIEQIEPSKTKSVAWIYNEETNLTFSLKTSDGFIPNQLISFKKLRESSQLFKLKFEKSSLDLILESKTSNVTGITEVVIGYRTIIENQLNEPLNLKVQEKETVYFRIEPNSFISSSINISKICGSLNNLTVLPDKMENVVLDDEKLSIIPVLTKANSKPINLALFVKKQNFKTKISIFSPSIILNQTPFKLNYLNDNMQLKNNIKQKAVYWSDDNFFKSKSKSLKLNLTLENETESEVKIDCLAAGTIDQIFIPLSKTDKIYLPLSYKIQSGNQNLFSSIVTFKPLLTVTNLLKYGFTLEPIISLEDTTKTGHSIYISSGSCETVKLCTENLTYMLSSEKSDRRIPISFGEPIKFVTFITENEKIMFEVNEDDDGILKGTISAATIEKSYCISNLTDYELKIKQKNGKIFDFVKSQTTSIVAFELPYSEHVLILQINNNELSVNADKITSPFQVGQFWLEVKSRENGMISIVIQQNEIEIIQKQKYLLTFLINSLSLSLIDEKFNELSLLTFKNLKFELKTLKSTSSIKVWLEQMQIDDQNSLALFDCVCYGMKKENNDFIEFSCEIYDDLKNFESIELNVQPLYLKLDVSFICEMFNFYNSFVKSQEIDFYSNSESTNKENNLIISSKSFLIHEINVFVTVENKNTRDVDTENVPVFIKFIPNLNEGLLHLPELPLSDFVSTQNFLTQRLIKPYLFGALKQLLKLLLHHDIFMNIGGVTANIVNGFDRLKSSPSRALCQITLGTAFAAGEGVLGSVSHLMHSIYDAESTSSTFYGARDSLINGISAIPQSLNDGIVGIIADPIDGAQREGFSGFAKGFGTGIVGLVARPVIGIVDGAASIVGGVRKAIEGKEESPKRIRKERVMPNSSIIPYSPELSEMQQTINESIICYFHDILRPSSVVISNNFITVFDVKGSEKIPIISIIAATVKGNRLELSVKDQKRQKISFEIAQKETVVYVARLLSSRANAIASNTARFL